VTIDISWQHSFKTGLPASQIRRSELPAAAMGGKSFFCPIFSFLRKSRRYDDDMSDWDGRTGYVRKVRSSDEDYGGWWVGERDVDRKASDFINNFHQKKLTV